MGGWALDSEVAGGCLVERVVPGVCSFFNYLPKYDSCRGAAAPLAVKAVHNVMVVAQEAPAKPLPT